VGSHSATYSNNLLNQITTREVPGVLAITGSAGSNATVTLWGSQGGYARTERHGQYFHGELPVTNAGGAVWVTVTNLAVMQNGTNADYVASSMGNDLIAQHPENFLYDADGNLSNDGRWNYTWDAENRLVAMESISGIPVPAKHRLEFVYDWQGRRIEKVVYSNDSSSYLPASTNRFVYDGWNLIARLDGAGNLLQAYVWGNDLSGSLQGAGGVGGLLAIIDHQPGTAGTYFPVYDGNGNIVALVNAANGTVAATYEYGPFGELLRATGPMAKANPFRWSTRYQDDETDLVMYPRRPYSASTGRWLSRDRIEERGGINLYAFLKNAPPNKVDPLGEDAAVVNAGGYTGHTSFVIVNPDGSGTAFHFFARHHGAGCCGTAYGPGSLMAICCDSVNIWSQPFDNFTTYLQAEEGIYGTTRVSAYALGTALDDQIALDALNEAAAADEGIYSLLLGIECHSKSWEWFNEYREGGPQIYPVPAPGTPPSHFWPERWFETRRYHESLPPFPILPTPAP
jgi:RHS repeat-associated protein